MAITFNCPCGKVLSSKERDAGLPAVCPNCGRRTIVPGERLPAPGTAESFRRSAFKAEDWIFGHTRQIWIGTAVLAVVSVGLLVAYFRWWTRPAEIDPANRPMIESKAIKVNVDPNADPALWKTDFASFVAALKQSPESELALQEKFSGQEIAWEVTYLYTLELKYLYFAEADVLREPNKATLVWASLLPAEAMKVDKLKRGKRILIRGKIGPASSGRSPDYPDGRNVIGPVQCTIEPIAD